MRTVLAKMERETIDPVLWPLLASQVWAKPCLLCLVIRVSMDMEKVQDRANAKWEIG